MSTWAAKRFWKETSVQAEEGGGFSVRLDGRPVKTPAKALLQVPTRALAQAVADEWEAQEGEIDPRNMPVTRSANAAIDKVAVQFDEVAAMIAEYGGSDLLCYRASGPDALVARQAAAWDPLLDWAAARFGARLDSTSGVMHMAQDEAALQRLAAEVSALDPFALTALHDLVGISGSLVIGLAAIEGWADIDQLWDTSRIDETWQAEQWGVDEEATEQATAKKQEFDHALRFFKLLQEMA